MKKLLVALALLTLSTVGYADDDRYQFESVNDWLAVIDTKTGEIAWCNTLACLVFNPDYARFEVFKNKTRKGVMTKLATYYEASLSIMPLAS